MADLRGLCKYMHLTYLLPSDLDFINGDFRDFLNINENGEDNYTWEEVTSSGSPWQEISSYDSQYHQSEAKNPDGSISESFILKYRVKENKSVPVYTKVYNRLNAKFIHPDGREAVFGYPGEGKHINTGPDRGTFNYRVAISLDKIGHGIYDVIPFEMNPPDGYDRFAPKPDNGSTYGNSYYWRY